MSLSRSQLVAEQSLKRLLRKLGLKSLEVPWYETFFGVEDLIDPFTMADIITATNDSSITKK